MSCIDCTKTKPIVACTQSLTLGLIEYISTNVYIWIENVTTGRLERVLGASNAAGVLALDMNNPDLNYFSPNQTFNIHVTLRDVNATEKIPVTIGTEASDCFELNFDKAYSTSTVISFASQILQLNEDFTLIQPLHHFNSRDQVVVDLDFPTQAREWYNLGTGLSALQSDDTKQMTLTPAGLNNQETVDSDGTELMPIGQSATPEFKADYLSIEMLVNTTDNTAFALYSYGVVLVPPLTSSFINFFADNATGLGEFGFEFIDGTNNNAWTSQGAAIKGNWVVIKSEFINGEVQLFQNGIPIQVNLFVDPVGDPQTVLPIFSSTHYIAGRNTTAAEIGSECKLRMLRVYTSEPSAEQKQLDTLEMLAAI